MKASPIGITSNIIIKLTKDAPSPSGVFLSISSALITINSLVIFGEFWKVPAILVLMFFFSVRINHYETNIGGLLYHVYYFAAIECILSVISLIVNIFNKYVYISMILSILSLLVMFAFIAILRNPEVKKHSLEIILLLKMIVCSALTVVYYIETFNLIFDPELVLLLLYFNGFYMIYIKTRNNGEDTGAGEAMNNPEDPTRPALLSTNPTRDSLPSYEESFNFPNSQFKNNKNVDKTKIDDSNNKKDDDL